jgi:putative ABC transport system permease protein
MSSRATLRWQTSLLTTEVALALVLLVGAGLLIRTFVNLRRARLGYAPRNVLTCFLALPAERSDRGSAELLYDRIRERLASLPGVQSVATATSTPAGGVDMSVEVEPEGHAARKGAVTATVDMISPRYFRTMGIALKAGRSFTPADRYGGPPVVIISDSIARKYFGGQALGRRLHIPAVNFALTDAKEVWAEVVGVVESVAVTSVGETTAEHIYLPEAQSPVRFTMILLRTGRDAVSFGPALRRAVYAESPLTPLDEVKSMEERTAYLTAAPRRAMWLLGLFAGIAGILSAIGIYAVSAYLSAQRAREFAIRMALGAGVPSLAGAVCRKPLGSILAGIALGTLSAFALTRLLKSLLFGVGNVDFSTYACAAIVLLACGLIALLRPALRTITMDVAKALRQE